MLGLVAFAGFWWVILSLLSNLGGWAAIAQRYPATNPPAGDRFLMQSARFGWIDYNGCLTMHRSIEGLWMRPLLPFRFGHPAIFLPWSELHVVEVIDRWWGRHVLVKVGEPTIAKIRLPLNLIEQAGKQRAI